MYQKSLFIFRRDLRLYDNTGLNRALAESEVVIPCFICDPRQCGRTNRYKSSNAVQFMIESLRDLDNQLRTKGSSLPVLYGRSEVVISDLIKKLGIDAVYVNHDYTPFSRSRDATIMALCKRHGCTFIATEDLLLMGSPEGIYTKKGAPMRMFTPFYRQWIALSFAKPQRLRKGYFWQKRLPLASIDLDQEGTASGRVLKNINEHLYVHGGRSTGKKLVQGIASQGQYRETKDYPVLPTTFLSAHHKFGTVSVRETAQAIIRHHGKDHELLRQLCWRDFFTYELWHMPQLLGDQCRVVSWQWKHDEKAFTVWCAGKTGFPFVDIGMRMLNKTGFMPNRMRMVAASYLTKTLRIDWRWGERYFARQLVDYDPAVNNGNWQWVASTGCDAQPPFRRFNPVLQMKRFGKGLQEDS